MHSPFAPGPRELRMAARLGFVKDGAVRAGQLAIALVAMTWLPLLFLTFMARSAYGDQATVPFLSDFFHYGRYLVALPILVLIHPYIDRQVSLAFASLREAGLVRPADDTTLRENLERARRLWLSPVIRLAIFGIAIASAFLMTKATITLDAPEWIFRPDSDPRALSIAGWWNAAVGGPLVRLLFLFAVWKLLIWSWFLLQLARMPLNYQTMHADGCAGLSIFERVQFGFSGIAAALGVQFGCIVADAVSYRGLELASFRLPAAVFVALMLLILLGPLAVFIRPVAAACIRAEQAFHAWYSRASHEVDKSLKQLGSEAVSSRLTSPEISSLTDASALYASAMRTRKIPVTSRGLLVVLAASVLPMCIPLLPLLPLKEIAARLATIVM
jgi:hypothetical protein